jgi:hypothetical protein
VRVDTTSFDAAEYGARVEVPDVERRRTEALVHRHEVVRPNELAQLSLLDLLAWLARDTLEHHEQVIAVGADLRHVVGLTTVAHGARVELEHVGEHVLGRIVDGGNIDPDEPVSAVEQVGEIVDGARLDGVRRDPADAYRVARAGLSAGGDRGGHHLRRLAVSLSPGLSDRAVERPSCQDVALERPLERVRDRTVLRVRWLRGTLTIHDGSLPPAERSVPGTPDRTLHVDGGHGPH